MSGYRPDSTQMWDAWCIADGQQVHMYHLQRPIPGVSADDQALGHAVSEDLVRWSDVGPAFGPNDAGTLDDLQPYTGSVIKSPSGFELFYTMRSSTDLEPGAIQRIGAASSNDLFTWSRSPHNPLITPDRRWYRSFETDADPHQVVDCRDLMVVEKEDMSGWLGFYATRTLGDSLGSTAAIACVESSDLVEWRSLPPALSGTGFACLEVPDVYRIGERWYLTCLVGNGYGNRGDMGEELMSRATVVATADRAEGPYRLETVDRVLLGGDDTSGYSLRSVVFQGELLGMYIEPTPDDDDRLSTPKRITVGADGALQLKWSERTEVLRVHRMSDNGRDVRPSPHWHLNAGSWVRTYPGAFAGIAENGWQCHGFDASAKDVEINFTISWTVPGPAGFVIRPEPGSNNSTGDLAIFVDPSSQTCAAMLLPHGIPFTRRHLPRSLGDVKTGLRVKALIQGSRCEVYLNEVLVLQFAHPRLTGSGQRSLGLFVENCEVLIADLEMNELEDAHPRTRLGVTAPSPAGPAVSEV